MAYQIPIRYFMYDTEIDTEIIEVGQGDFERWMKPGDPVEYERDTIRENGVAQVCLTLRRSVADGGLV
ncbi:hypothetical protein [Martelella mangrovi]|uniref:Uncharacterized protein n=1 Tax=Martelella mangrovi TaxID=1397477 RepID=A0ABV2IG29_9HYPH